MKKAQKIQLEIIAIELWFQNFGFAGYSSDADRVYMSTKLNKLKNELNNIKNK